jgi:hypothetical protein
VQCVSLRAATDHEQALIRQQIERADGLIDVLVREESRDEEVEPEAGSAEKPYTRWIRREMRDEFER